MRYLFVTLSASLVTLCAAAACSSFEGGADIPADAARDEDALVDSGPTERDATPREEKDGAVAPTYPELVMADAPIAYWRMESAPSRLVPNEVDGGTALQVVGDASIVNGGDAGTWASFDGVSGRMVAAQSVAFQFFNTDAFTIEMWVRYGTVDPKVKGFLAFDGPDDGAQPAMARYFLELDKSTTSVRFARGGSATLISTAPVPLPADSLFHHVAVVYDSSTLVCIVDGKPSPQKNATDNLTANSRTFMIGGGGASLFLGDIDEVAVYDKALTITALQAHYGKGHP